ALEPGLAIPRQVREVAFFADDAWLDAPRLIGTVLDSARGKGADVRANTPVRAFRVEGGRVDALVTDGGEIRATSVVMCVGPGTREFLAPLGATLPVDRVYGELTITSRPNVALARVVHAPGIHLRPDAGGGLM